MQSFKQYLTEEVGNLPSVLIQIELISSNNDISFVLTDIKKLLLTEYNIGEHNITVETFLNNATIEINVFNLSETNYKSIDDIFTDCHDTVLHYLAVKDAYYSIANDWPAAYPIECDNLTIIDIKKNNLSLKNLSQLVKPGEYGTVDIVIHKGITIGLLPLLDMKANYIKVSVIDFDENKDYELNKIISIHLGRGRDKIDCQEELIEAGFKEFAKL